ncbi:hypothetical protein OFY05_23085 (plasmid) [Pseudocitrobacter faecalis]|nr:hypothetical protein OFY05_23085 [Pseudocitrobacter faecalis]
MKINGHESHCSYTVCQHTILAYKEKRLPATSFQSCAAAIASGRCQALKMMVEEIQKGEQLYFIDMAALIKEVEEQNDHASTLTRKRNTMTINSLVKPHDEIRTSQTRNHAHRFTGARHRCVRGTH